LRSKTPSHSLNPESPRRIGLFSALTRLRRHALFLGILLAATVSYFIILFQSQTHVHSDEAIIGLMGKHILEGRYLPFYMYGQSYNAGAAWEAYLAAISFGVFGVGVVPLKSCIVVLSLVCLVLFYTMAHRFYGRRTAVLGALAFALSPSLLKWHFQVRGYSWYFLSLPILVSLFWSIDSCSPPRGAKTFLFGLASGLSVWCLELVLTPVAALWLLLALRRKLSLRNAAVGVLGLATGYAPAVVFNLTHQFSNWQDVFVDKGSGVSLSLFYPATFGEIFFQEMPKLFGPDTVLWYYPENPASGYVFYAIAMVAVAAAILPFLKAPSKIRRALGGGSSDEDKDLLMLVLIAACFMPYLIASQRVPGYFLGGCFFLSVLTGRLLARCFAALAFLPRLIGAVVLSAVLLVGAGVLINTGQRNEIETLTLNNSGNLDLARIPGADLEAVERYLRRNEVPCVQTTVSFVYPLQFESGEKLAISDAILGWNRRVYPATVPWHEPHANQRTAFVMETKSPLRASVEAAFARDRHAPPQIAEFGTLTVIETKPLSH
jgi:4-amino-4-deoxy-L-arabinose transferase-like glycosyltransferase